MVFTNAFIVILSKTEWWNKMKKEWKKPQIIVVTRGSSEENVLDGCKGNNSTGPDLFDTSCNLGFESGCVFCSNPTLS
jgi:hypothetical protein